MAPTVASDFAAVIEKAIQPNYLHRYANAAEMFDAVRTCIRQSFDRDSKISTARTSSEVLIETDETERVSEVTAVSSNLPNWPLQIIEPPALGERGLVDLALEISKTALVYRDGIGIVIFEPSIVAINKLTDEVRAVGNDAEDLLLIAESDLEIVRPFEHGKVTDRKLAAAMLKHFINKACGGDFPYRQRIVFAIPSNLTKVERRAIVDAAYQTGAAEVYLSSRPACAAVGANLSMKGEQGNMIVHVGENATEILATSGGRQASFQLINVGLDSMYEAIRQHVKLKYNLLIGERSTAAILTKIGSASPLAEVHSMETTGRNLIEGIPKTVKVDDEEIRHALEDTISIIVDGLRLALERTPPEVSADIASGGIILSGIGTSLKNLEKRLSNETRVPVSIAQEPVSCVTMGAAKMLRASRLRQEKRATEYNFVDGTAGQPRTFVRGLLSLLSHDLAIDIGAANALVYAKRLGIVISEPALIAVNRMTGKIEAFGRDAKEMLGRSSYDIIAMRPTKEGVIADTEIATIMLRYLIRKAHKGWSWARPRVVLSVPSSLTKVEQEAFLTSAFEAGASETYLVEQPMAAAIGAGLPVTEPTGNLLVDVGGALTEIAIISLSGIVYSRQIRVGGDEMNEAITAYVKRKYNLLIGERTAEALKIELGSAFPLDEELSYEVRGKNVVEGIPKTVTITDDDIRDALADSVSTIINAVRVALERTPPELASDIVERGVVLTGGGALLKNLDKRLSLETGLPVAVAEDPLASVILGTGKMLNDFDLLRQITWSTSRVTS